MTKTALQEQKLNTLVRQTIIRTVQEVLRDPDYGLEVQDWVKKRLVKKSEQLISLEDIKKRYGRGL